MKLFLHLLVMAAFVTPVCVYTSTAVSQPNVKVGHDSTTLHKKKKKKKKGSGGSTAAPAEGGGGEGK